MSRSDENADRADLDEQRRSITDEDAADAPSPAGVADVDADEADVLEQAAPVPADDEDYPQDDA